VEKLERSADFFCFGGAVFPWFFALVTSILMKIAVLPI
jgi:hypothetical protein